MDILGCLDFKACSAYIFSELIKPIFAITRSLAIPLFQTVLPAFKNLCIFLIANHH